MKGKKLILGLYHLLKYVLYVNIVLAGGVIGFQIINLFRPDKTVIASYLGKFAIEMNSTGFFKIPGGEKIGAYAETISGLPSIVIDLPQHGFYVLIFTICVVSIALFYNFQFYNIFKLLIESIKAGTPFTMDISKILKSITLFSIGVFIVGTILSIIKVWLFSDIVFDNFVARPVFDNNVLNFLWFGLGIFILNEIYKVGITIEKEQEFTI